MLLHNLVLVLEEIVNIIFKAYVQQNKIKRIDSAFGVTALYYISIKLNLSAKKYLF